MKGYLPVLRFILYQVLELSHLRRERACLAAFFNTNIYFRIQPILDLLKRRGSTLYQCGELFRGCFHCFNQFQVIGEPFHRMLDKVSFGFLLSDSITDAAEVEVTDRVVVLSFVKMYFIFRHGVRVR